ncbi:MAG: glycosyltransferase family 9 protein [Actinomycetota bacterium]|nr:glycosyltransferase family 9 protein [Actinomycetota bacterium]
MALIERPRLLLLRALGLGDFLTGVPAVRALRRAFPEHEMVLAAPAVLKPLVELSGTVDGLLDACSLGSPVWTGDPPDLAVNLHGWGPQSHEILRRLKPVKLVAFGCAAAFHAGPSWDPEEHETRRWCRLLEESLHIDTCPGDLALAPPSTPAAAPGAVVIHPGAAYPSRRWPPDRFAHVARAAVAAGHEVVITGGPDEKGLAELVCREARLPQRVVQAGRSDLAQLAAQVASARLLVCGDTGVAHLATAFSTPSVLLFGPTPPSRWGPPADGPHTVIWHGEEGGKPWGDRVDTSLLRIGVEEVVARALEMLDGAVTQS